MELAVQNLYHARIKKNADADFTIKDLERYLKNRDNLYIRFILKDVELISFIYDDYKIKDLKKGLSEFCEIKQVTVKY